MSNMRLMNSHSIDRRRFLQGAGLSLALPFLKSGAPLKGSEGGERAASKPSRQKKISSS